MVAATLCICDFSITEIEFGVRNVSLAIRLADTDISPILMASA